ncbi:lipid IV(A) 3-deoxy-D-manno-octulosonic acid transferase [Azoarcus sp. KH32C]|uniref:lipid IV(A) 3-deoxy-D-manno-octulosonic acid transferase n=1 Tax=Azoarcus sp. KH32C TaxID=748247 RepID=UPI0002386E07|nr:lipid IV(A) 3-deoxy-D-manno-octulosonic acid transferase [Azoarcus sp. KH32C]BAL26060.1 3-deoxy-D-manno-octulosonic-acid transferase [Azoarcus sp. KH32C]
MPARLAYSLLWLIALPFVAARLLWRARRQPEYLQNLGERFGRYPVAAPAQLIWVHAVSVGETRAAEPLVRAMLDRWPECSVLLTHMTPTGRETSASLFGNERRVLRAYLPYDLKPCVTSFLRHFRPQAGIVMETELWPTLLGACRDRGVPVLLANARLSERSARRYAQWPSLSRLTLGALTAIGAQTEADAARLLDLGAHGVEITGNIKFDMAPPATLIELGSRFRTRTANRPVILAASTRDGEEALILDAFVAATPPEALLVIVPRHPQRFGEVATLVANRGLALQRRSDEAPVSPATRVWLGDSMGEMFAYYAAADVVLMGGSWLPFGGQNLIEACAVGTPVILGPHTYNFSLVAEQAVAAGTALREDDVESGMRAALALLREPARRAAMGRAGLAFSASHRGATARTLTLVAALLECREADA